MEDQEPTNREILEAVHDAVHALASHMDARFKDFGDELRTELRAEIRQSEANTRDFVDRRIADVEAQFAPKMRAIDEKDSALIDTVAEKGVISPAEAKQISAMSPFPTA